MRIVGQPISRFCPAASILVPRLYNTTLFYLCRRLNSFSHIPTCWRIRTCLYILSLLIKFVDFPYFSAFDMILTLVVFIQRNERFLLLRLGAHKYFLCQQQCENNVTVHVTSCNTHYCKPKINPFDTLFAKRDNVTVRYNFLIIFNLLLLLNQCLWLQSVAKDVRYILEKVVAFFSKLHECWTSQAGCSQHVNIYWRLISRFFANSTHRPDPVSLTLMHRL